MKKLKFITIILFSVALFMSSFSQSIYATESGLLKDIATEMSDDNIKEIELDLTQVRESESTIKDVLLCNSSESEYQSLISDACSLVPHQTETIYYEKALDYGDKLIDIRLDITRVSEKIDDSFKYNTSYTTEQINHIVRLKDNRIRFYGFGEFNGVGETIDNTTKNRSRVQVVTSFYYNGEPFKVSGFIGIQDPDGANYLFDNKTSRKVYYSNAPLSGERTGANVDEIYFADSNGFYRNDSDDYENTFEMPYWEDAKFAIELLNENSFTVTYDIHHDYIILPTMYAVYYNIEYDMNDGGDPTTVNPNEDWTKYMSGDSGNLENPSRTGYRFTGWTRTDVPDSDPKHDNIATDDREDKKFVAHWEAIEYKLEYDKNHKDATGTMDDQTVTIGDNDLHENGFILKGYKFKGWSTKEGENPVEYQPTDKNVPVTETDVKDKEDGDTVKVLYAQWEPLDYTIIYDGNGGKGSMDPNEYLGSDETMPSEKEWEFTREGYTFAGFKVENKGETYNGSKDFKDTLLDEEDRTIVLYAQWEPWKYYINYDANGGSGTMNPQTFTYTSDTMNSKENEFIRSGYRFTGFKYEFNGNVRIIRTPQDFKALLLELGPNSQITLIAQWEKIPQDYVAPVTGVE